MNNKRKHIYTYMMMLSVVCVYVCFHAVAGALITRPERCYIAMEYSNITLPCSTDNRDVPVSWQYKSPNKEYPVRLYLFGRNVSSNKSQISINTTSRGQHDVNMNVTLWSAGGYNCQDNDGVENGNLDMASTELIVILSLKCAPYTCTITYRHYNPNDQLMWTGGSYRNMILNGMGWQKVYSVCHNCSENSSFVGFFMYNTLSELKGSLCTSVELWNASTNTYGIPDHTPTTYIGTPHPTQLQTVTHPTQLQILLYHVIIVSIAVLGVAVLTVVVSRVVRRTGGYQKFVN